MPRARLTSKGQVTIPKAIREGLNLEAGVTLHFSIDHAGRIVVTPLTLGMEDLIGILPKPRRALTNKEMDEAVVQGAVEHATRSL